jgi:proline iminopeptidase
MPAVNSNMRCIMRRRKWIMMFLFAFSASHAQYRSVSSHGLDVAYRVFGQGKPVLILSGGPGDVSDRVLGICDLISPLARCILVDQRGTGRSTPSKLDSTTISVDLTLDDFEAIRKHLGLKDWSVLGVSYGGYLASLYAAFHPSSVSSLILVGTMGLNTDMFEYFLDNINSRLLPSDLALVEYWADSTRMARDRQAAIVQQIRARMPAYFFDRKKSLEVSEIMKTTDFNFDVGQWMWPDIVKRDLDLLKMNTTFDKPVLVLAGRQDPVGGSVPVIVSRHYPKSTLIWIEKSGHYSWVEKPEEFVSAIQGFLNK